MRKTPLALWTLLVLLSIFLFGQYATTLYSQDAEPKKSGQLIEAEKLFTLKVLPLLKSRCLGCHGEEPSKLRGGFDVRSREALLKGGDSGLPSIIPGNAKDSPLHQAVLWSDLKMPPKENDRLSKTEIGWLRNWIDAGAPWPNATVQAKYQKENWSLPVNEDGVLVKTSGGQNDEWTNRRYALEDLWAIRPVKKIAPPAKSHPIDAFINKELDKAGIKPAPKAEKLTLIRRATYDLTGLPPSPDEVARFINDNSPDAWEKLIDRLLASPHYGEQWGRHWLDVTRYADTSGYSNDWERSNAWRYRDYVVRAFNNDKPYDRFIMEQIAGDELDPNDPEMLIAVGFLRMGPWEHTGMSQVKVSRQLWLDDVTNSVGQVFLSTALRCCKCHDHKFDPLPTLDYYRFQAAFATTQLAERKAPFLESENLAGLKEGKARLQKLLQWANADVAKIKAKEAKAGREWCEERGLPHVDRYSKEAKQLPEEQKPPRFVGLDHTDQGFLKVRLQDARIWNRRLERYQPLAQSVYNGGNLYPNSIALRMPSKNWEITKAKVLPKVFVLAGGSISSPLDETSPGALSAVPFLLPKERSNFQQPNIPQSMQGRRLALARWIAHPQNPLTTRSIVNRIWQYHFGRGIAENANNFGMTGKKPTHPELLDWLAQTFVEDGWSFKKMHRLIMTSDAYQRSSEHPDHDSVKRKDATNQLLSHFMPRRLTAEELRDSMLVVSGQLNDTIGGLPIKPEINLEVALQPRMLQNSLAPAYQPSSQKKDRHRRSLYAYQCRGQADPFSEVFNQPNPNDSCEFRDSSTVTPQVFMLMNSQSSMTHALEMAQHLQKQTQRLEDQINLAFQLCYGRLPRPNERDLLANHARQMIPRHRENPPKKVLPPTEVTRSVVEELSGKSFDYVERLDVYENYEPHVRAWETTPETRALADICLILMNSNEFVYVY